MGNHVIYDRLWESDKLAGCSREAALAYPWIFLVADDHGRFEYKPRAIWKHAFAYRGDVTVEDVARWLDEYWKAGLLIRYHIQDEDGGGGLAHWYKFKGRKPSDRRPSEYPDPKEIPTLPPDTATIPPRRGVDPATPPRETRARAEVEQSRAEVETEHVTGTVSPSNGNGHRPVPSEQRQEYADAVWSEFLRVSGTRGTRLMAPGEFNALKGWMDSGVPLSLVLRAMEDTRGKASAKSLGYFGPSVKAAIETWRKAVS